MDVRIISSCNKDPFQCIADNQLRKDLFYRLSTVMIELPSLSMHMEDLEELVQYHLSATAYQYVHSATSLDDQVMELFRSYSCREMSGSCSMFWTMPRIWLTEIP